MDVMGLPPPAQSIRYETNKRATPGNSVNCKPNPNLNAWIAWWTNQRSITLATFKEWTLPLQAPLSSEFAISFRHACDYLAYTQVVVGKVSTSFFSIRYQISRQPFISAEQPVTSPAPFTAAASRGHYNATLAMSETAVTPPVPWPYIAARKPDGTLTYYIEESPLCLPSARALVPRVYTPPNPTTYIGEPTRDLSGSKVLLIVNPAAGRGKSTPASRASALQTVSEVLQENGALAIVRTTERPGHVLEMMKEMGYAGLCEFAAVLSVGGDGTLHELVNAMVKVCSVSNADWSKVPPIAVMPCGSGNAIAVSTGIVSPVHAALNIVHALRTESAKPLALMQYRAASSESPRDLISVGGLQWGFPAEIDYGTEKLRWMGDTRYDVGALQHIIAKKFFSARISVTVDSGKTQQLWKELQQYYSRKKGGNTRDMADGLEHVERDTYVLDGRFALAVGWKSSKIADGFMLTPLAKPTETGVFDFIVIHGDLSRMEMINIMTRVGHGEFLGVTDAYHMFKATKVVFDRVDGKYLTIDGELVSMEPFVFEMAPEDGKLRFLDSFSDP